MLTTAHGLAGTTNVAQGLRTLFHRQRSNLQARGPDGMTIHGKRFPLPEEKLMLTDGMKCNVRFENRAMDE